ncbi:MAG: BlaI/MecI/CopY family transcriptional regulator [Chlorobi bacterium]|nr:BlaI/MecI/CopY family transcriptional regulator [Chlorobiota bacterium]
MRNPNPTPAELEILTVLWQYGPATVRFVNDEQNRKRRVGYTTTLKLMQIMTEKKLLGRKRISRTHEYTPLVKQRDMQHLLVNKLLDSAFHGSPGEMVMEILGHYRPDEQERERIREYLDDLENKRHESH